jgi:hypothetical protein
MGAEALTAWITEHRVCWELSPRVEVHEHKKIQVGYDLTLFARHPESWKDEPGCQHCLQHYETLKEIALQALPQTHASRCEFAPFDASFHLRPEANWEPEVQLDVAILHRDSTFADVDEDERTLAAAIEQGLKRLGAKPKAWPGAEPVNRAR